MRNCATERPSLHILKLYTVACALVTDAAGNLEFLLDTSEIIYLEIPRNRNNRQSHTSSLFQKVVACIRTSEFRG